MKEVLCLCLLLLLAGGLSYGQSNEVSYSAGATLMSAQTVTETFTTTPPIPCAIPGCNVLVDMTKSSTGFTFEASSARRVAGVGPMALYLELPVAGTPGHGVVDVLNVNRSTPLTGSTSSSLFFLTPSARVKFFSSARFSPWATVGGGWARLTLGGQNANTGALQFGGGVDFKTGVPHLGLRVEVRDFWAGSVSKTSSQSLALGGTLQATSVTSAAHHLLAGGGVVLRF